MKRLASILLLVYLSFTFILFGCSDDNSIVQDPPQQEEGDKNDYDSPENGIDYDKVGLEYDDGTNLVFHIKIAIDKEGYNMKNKMFFINNLKKQWEDINIRFNALDKEKQLKRNYIFVPDLDDIIIYDFKDKDSHWTVNKDYASRIDFNKYQCLVAYDFVVQQGEGGGGCGDDGKGMSNILVINPSENNIGKFYDHFQDKANTVAAITHELGHFRGIWDLYVINFSGKNNPVNGEGFRAPDGVMNDNTYGPIKKVYWNEYEILCLNACLARKEYRLYDTCLWEYFTDNIEINVTEKGEDVSSFTLNFYKYSSGKIDSNIHFTQKVEGSALRKDARQLFWYGTAYFQWTSMFLLEVVNSKTGHKGYRFLPYYEPHTQGLKDKSANLITGKSTYRINIDIK